MTLELTDGESETLGALLDDVLGDMSTEIAHTDNPSYRAELSRRRDALREVRRKLAAS